MTYSTIAGVSSSTGTRVMKLFTLISQAAIADPMKFMTVQLGRNISSVGELTAEDVERLITELQDRITEADTDWTPRAAPETSVETHTATALDQLRLADDFAETREQMHAAALAGAQVHAQLALAEAVRAAARGWPL
ncbi:MAG TPA: hypothetical protein VIP28_15430 [Nocardioides sp.]